MLEKEWLSLKDKDKVWNKVDGELTVLWHDFYGEGKKIMCLCDEKSIWPAWQFDYADWEKIG